MAGDVTFWTVTSASGDHQGFGCGASAYWTETEAYNALRDDLLEDADENMFETDEEFEEHLATIRKMTNAEVGAAHEDMRGQRDYIWEVSVQKHTLAPPPDVSTPEKVEEFLG